MYPIKKAKKKAKKKGTQANLEKETGPVLLAPSSAISLEENVANRNMAEIRDAVLEQTHLGSTSQERDQQERYALHEFEKHVSGCVNCQYTDQIELANRQLCELGYSLAQKVYALLYQRVEEGIYNITREGNDVGEGCFLESVVLDSCLHSRALFKVFERDLRLQKAQFLSAEQAKPAPPNEERKIYFVSKSRPSGTIKLDKMIEERMELNARAKQKQSENRMSHKIITTEPRLSTHLEPKPSTQEEELHSSRNDEICRKEDQAVDTKLSDSMVDRDHMPLTKSFAPRSLACDASTGPSRTHQSRAARLSRWRVRYRMAIVTIELVALLQKDEALQPLYTVAMGSIIGRERLAKSLPQLLKRYSENMKQDAQDEGDKIAAFFVAVRAKDIADSILDGLQKPIASLAALFQGLDSLLHIYDKNVQNLDRSIGKCKGTENESVFQGLTFRRDLYAGSKALEVLRADLRELIFAWETVALSRHSFDSSSWDSKRMNDTAKTSVAPAEPEISPGLRTRYSSQIPPVRRLSYFLSELPTVSQLHHKALSRIGKASFVTKYRPLLNDYYRNLRGEAHEPVEKAIIRLIGMSWNSARVARGVVEALTDAKDEDELPQIDGQARKMGDPELFNAWLVCQRQRKPWSQSVNNADDASEVQHCETEVAEALMDIEHDSEPDLPDSDCVWRFLYHGVAARTLLSEIKLLGLHWSLTEIIETVPKRDIKISWENCESWLNKAKGFMEDNTILEWEWWPLGPRKHDLKPDERRLEWKWFGKQLYRQLSISETNTMNELLRRTPDHPSRCHCCNIGVRQDTQSQLKEMMTEHLVDLLQRMVHIIVANIVLGTTILVIASLPNITSRILLTMAYGMIFPKWLDTYIVALIQSMLSKASERYTPVISTSANASRSSPLVTQLPSPSSTITSTSRSTSDSSQARGRDTSTSSTTSEAEHRVLFAVQGVRWSLEIEQISITSIVSDHIFFRELKTRYRKHCSQVKYCLSPFRFRNCKFVKFEKFGANRVISPGEDLPDSRGFAHDYEYSPRPGEIPLIDRQTFSICLEACDTPCIWSHLGRWHDCIRLDPRSDRLRCIPKKKTEFDVSSADQECAWGIKADHVVSFAILAVYHLIPIFTAFGFWVYWLVKNPGDWQNAAVPILTVLALFAVFWIPFAKHLELSSS